MGDRLVDLHGQHDHQMLLREEHHRGVVDAFGNLDELLADYRETYDRMRGLRSELRKLRKRESELEEKRELYSFQVKELEEAQIEPGEEEELEAEMNLLDNAEELDEKAAAVVEMGGGDEGASWNCSTA
ncbi:MAG: hypothetical protein U5K31_06730 [Balneolaceae bacterium]|nr:hypothetical protein [Balneolaceae bacterium]